MLQTPNPYLFFIFREFRSPDCPAMVFSYSNDLSTTQVQFQFFCHMTALYIYLGDLSLHAKRYQLENLLATHILSGKILVLNKK